MASLSAALKAAVVASAVASTRVYQDEAPPGTTRPFVVYHDLDDSLVLEGDGGEDLARRRILQADLYFDAASEDKVAVKTLREALTGAVLGSSDEGKGFRLRVPAVIRRYDHDSQTVWFTLDLRATYLA